MAALAAGTADLLHGSMALALFCSPPVLPCCNGQRVLAVCLPPPLPLSIFFACRCRALPCKCKNQETDRQYLGWCRCRYYVCVRGAVTAARRSPLLTPPVAAAASRPPPSPRPLLGHARPFAAPHRGSPPSAPHRLARHGARPPVHRPSPRAARRQPPSPRPLLTGSPRAARRPPPLAAPAPHRLAAGTPAVRRPSPRTRRRPPPLAANTPPSTAPRRARSSPPRAARPCPLLTATRPPSTAPRRGHAVRRPLPHPLLTAPSNSNPPRLRTRAVDVLPRPLRYGRLVIKI
eukprot:XP_020393529.1 extensin-like [Zea mays]